MQLTESQVKQAIGDLYLDHWGVSQATAALVAKVRELEAKVKELEAAKVPAATTPAETE